MCVIQIFVHHYFYYEEKASEFDKIFSMNLRVCVSKTISKREKYIFLIWYGVESICLDGMLLFY